MNEELTTSKVMIKIGADYLCNGCDGCDYLKYDVCDAIPLNCVYMKLHYYFKGVEEKESEGKE